MAKSDIYTERSWPFTPTRVKDAIKFARDTDYPRWVWRDIEKSSPYLHLIVGRRSAAYYHRAKKDGRVQETRLGDAEGPASLTLDEARKRSNQLQYGAELPTNRKSKKLRAGITTDQVFDKYLEEVTAGSFTMRGPNRPLAEKTRVGYASNYHVHIQPTYGDRDFGLFVTDAPGIVRRITGDHPALSNQVLAISTALIQYARRRGLYKGTNTLRDDDESFRADVRGREVMLKADEVVRLRKAIESQPEYWQDLFTFVMLTGRRLGNARNLTWEQVDLKGGSIRYKSESMKVNLPSVIPITAPMEKVLRRRLKDVPSGSPFVWPQKRNPQKPVDNPYDAWHIVRTQAGLPTLVIHELRHLAITWASSAEGVPAAAVSKMAHHIDPQTTAKYQHLHGEAARPALEAVAARWENAKSKPKKRAKKKVSKRS